VGRLRLALQGVADALALADLSRLLALEEELAAAVTDSRRVSGVLEDDRPALRRELEQARVLLSRCRTVGAAITQTTAARLVVQGCHGQYDKAGAPALSSSQRSSVEVRA
jgi:hypothetical protein